MSGFIIIIAYLGDSQPKQL